LLSGGGPAGPPHHRTLQAALEWSYELLTDGVQAMWRRVSVFAGSFDLDAAEAVCAVGRVAAGQIADLVDALVAKSSLLREGQGTARYRLLETSANSGVTKLRGVVAGGAGRRRSYLRTAVRGRVCLLAHTLRLVRPVMGGA
jgi:non-specific serine/threonine protein kinase